jgi:hypothetical protein
MRLRCLPQNPSPHGFHGDPLPGREVSQGSGDVPNGVALGALTPHALFRVTPRLLQSELVVSHFGRVYRSGPSHRQDLPLLALSDRVASSNLQRPVPEELRANR